MEPMSDEEIRKELDWLENSLLGSSTDPEFWPIKLIRRLILTIAHERAHSAQVKFWDDTILPSEEHKIKWTDADWVRAELLAIGWPEKELP